MESSLRRRSLRVSLALLVLATAHAAQVGHPRRLNEPFSVVPSGDVETFAVTADGQGLAYWVRELDGHLHLYFARTDGSGGAIELSESVEVVTPPRFAAGDTRLVYREGLVFDTQPGRLFSVPVDGSAPATDLVGQHVTSFDVSPDGERVVYRADVFTDQRFLLFSRRADGSSGAIVLNGPLVANSDVLDFAIGPDSLRVVYRADAMVVDRAELFSAPIDAAGAAVALSGTIVPGGNVLSQYSIAPDATRVVFRADRAVNEQIEVWSSPLTGLAPPVRLNPALGSGSDVLIDADISPDSARVAFRVMVAGDAELYVNDIGGGALRKLNPLLVDGGGVAEHAFTPDSARVVYRADQDTDEVRELYTVPCDGSGPAQKLSPPLADGADVSANFLVGSSRAVFTTGAGRSWTLYSSPFDASAPALALDGHDGSGGAAGPLLALDLGGTRVLHVNDGVDGAELRSARLDGSLAARTLNGGDHVGEFAMDPNGQSVLFTSDDDVAGVIEVFRRGLDGGAPAIRVSRALPGASVGGTVPGFRLAGSRVLFVVDRDASGENALYAASPGGARAPERLSEAAIDVQGTALPTDDGARALFRGVAAGHEWLFAAPLQGAGPTVVLNLDPLPASRITSFVPEPGGAFAVFRGDQEVDERFELYAAPIALQGAPEKLSGTLVAGGDVLDAYRVSSDGARVAYVADQDADEVFELFVTDGGTLLRVSGALVAGGDVQTDIAFSLDGSRVYYRADQEVDQRFELYMAPSDGSAPAQKLNAALPAFASVSGYGLSPDGAVTVYLVAQSGTVLQVVTTSADGSGSFLVPLQATSGFVVDPQSARVVFVDAGKLFSAPLDGIVPPVRLSGTETVLELSPSLAVPRCQITPDGATVVYMAFATPGPRFDELYAVPIDGSAPPVRINAPIGTGDVRAFRLDPTDAWAAYVRQERGTPPGVRSLWLAPLDGARPVRLVQTTGVPSGGVLDDFAFSADGLFLLHRIDPVQRAAYDLFATRLRAPFPAGGPTPR